MEQNESIPLIQPQSPQNQQRFRQNLHDTLQQSLYTSYLLVSFRLLITISKLAGETAVIAISQVDLNFNLFWWLLISLILDIIYFILMIVRFPHIRQVRLGQQVPEPIVLQYFFRIQSILYILWIIPGNVWYWRCQNCVSQHPAITYLTLAFLILGYIYLIIPGLILIGVCMSIPISILFLVFVSNSYQQPASESMIEDLETFCYSPEKHGHDPCTICAVEYCETDEVVVMKCDERHLFHEECIKRWLRINSNCPICRAPFMNYR